MSKRYTSRELIKLAEEYGWRLVSVKGDHHNFKHPESRFVGHDHRSGQQVSFRIAVETS